MRSSADESDLPRASLRSERDAPPFSAPCSPCRPYHQNERGPGTQAASSWLLHTYMDIFFDDRARSERWPDAEQATRLHHATNAADEWWTTEP